MTTEDITAAEADARESPPRFLSITGLFAGPLLAMGVYLLLLWQSPDLPHAPRVTASIAVLMSIWWMTEAIPLEATALLPLVLLPMLGAVKNFQAAATPFADKSIFLYLGGFILRAGSREVGAASAAGTAHVAGGGGAAGVVSWRVHAGDSRHQHVD